MGMGTAGQTVAAANKFKSMGGGGAGNAAAAAEIKTLTN